MPRLEERSTPPSNRSLIYAAGFLLLTTLLYYATLNPSQHHPPASPPPVKVSHRDRSDYDNYCRMSLLTTAGGRNLSSGPLCLSGYALIRILYDKCGRPEPPRPPPPPQTTLEKNLNSLREVLEERDRTAPTPAARRWSARPQLIYQIIVVLLLVSVTTSLIDCFKQRYKSSPQEESGGVIGSQGQGEGGSGGGGSGDQTPSRRMSLADLTMSRHFRKQSQMQAYRPTGATAVKGQSCRRRSTPGQEHEEEDEDERRVGRRGVTRQWSCPQASAGPRPHLPRRLSSLELRPTSFDEDASPAAPTRRRVRMIHRH